MSESIPNHKTYKTIDEQIKYLKESKKIIVDKEDEHWFIDVNYITLINPYKDFLANGKDSNGNHIYPNYVNYKELLKIMNLELQFSDVLYKDIRNFERKFKNVTFSILCKRYVQEQQDIYCLNYVNEIYNFNNQYSIEKNNKSILKYPMFCTRLFNTLTKSGYIEKDYDSQSRVDLLQKIYCLGTGLKIDDCKVDTKNKLITHYVNRNRIAPLWTIPNALTLGEISMIFSMLDESIQNEIYCVMQNKTFFNKDSKFEYQKLSKYTGKIEYIRNMRNVINHYEPIFPTLVATINNKAKLIKSSQLVSSLELLNDQWVYTVKNNQNLGTNLNLNIPITTYNLPKIRLLELMETYIEKNHGK